MTGHNGHQALEASKEIHHWWLLPRGRRYPYPAGRCCCYCATPLSRYNAGPACEQHTIRDLINQLEAAG